MGTLIFPFLLGADFTDILDNAFESSTEIQESWDDVFNNVFGGDSFSGDTLFGVVSELGQYIAVFAVVIGCILLYRDYSNKRQVEWELLIWPVIALALFGGSGALMGQLIIGIRGALDTLNDQVTSSVIAGVRLDDALQNLGGSMIFRNLIEQEYRRCADMMGEARVECLNAAADQAGRYADSFSGIFTSVSWIGRIVDKFTEAGEALRSGDGAGLIGMFSPVWQPILYSIMFALMTMYQNLLQAVMVLLGLLLPLAAGGSLIMKGSLPITAWFSGFFSLGLANILFNLLIGLTAAVLSSADLDDPLWFPLFLGLGAPFLSIVMASFSGYAIWAGLANVGSTIASGGISILKK